MKIRAGLVALLAVTGAGAESARVLPVGSAESMDGLMTAWVAGFSAARPGNSAQITRREKFSADLLEPLARGELKVAPFARELFPRESVRFRELAGDPPLLVPVATGSRATKGGTHAIALFVHERNPLARLTVAQVREIFARDGRITTWGQLGLTAPWAARPIRLHGMRARRGSGNPPGIVNFLEARLLAGRPWREIQEHDDTPGGPQALEHITRAVAADEAAIGYSGFAYAVPGVKTLALGESEHGPFYAGSEEEVARREYPLTRTLYLAASRLLDNASRDFLRHALSPAGQELIAKDTHGFFPLPPAELSTARVLVAGLDPALPAYSPLPVTVPTVSSYVTEDGALAIIGYNDMKEMVGEWSRLFATTHPGIRFDHRLLGTRTAPPALARGRSLLAPMGADFSPAELADYRAATGHEPLVIRVAHCSLDARALSGPLAILVHRDNPLSALTLAEVAEIFSGRNTRGLRPCGLNPETALGLFLRREVLAGGGFGPDFRGFGQSGDVVKAVAADRNAIGFAAANRATEGVRIVALARRAGEPPVLPEEDAIRAGRYPLNRHLLLQARRPLDPVAREYLRLVLSCEGQEAVAGGSLGYLPLNAEEVAGELAKLE